MPRHSYGFLARSSPTSMMSNPCLLHVVLTKFRTSRPSRFAAPGFGAANVSFITLFGGLANTTSSENVIVNPFVRQYCFTGQIPQFSYDSSTVLQVPCSSRKFREHFGHPLRRTLKPAIFGYTECMNQAVGQNAEPIFFYPCRVQ